MAHKGYTLRSGRRVLGTIHPTSDRGVYRWHSNFTKDGGVTSSLGNAERLLIKEAKMTQRQYEISLVDNETGKSRPALPSSPSRDHSGRTVRKASKTRQANEYLYRAKKAETEGDRAAAAVWYKKAAAALDHSGQPSKRAQHWRSQAQHLTRRRTYGEDMSNTSRDKRRQRRTYPHEWNSPAASRSTSTITKAHEFLKRGRLAEMEGNFHSAGVWYEKGARLLDRVPSMKARARLWHRRAKDVRKDRKLGTLHRGAARDPKWKKQAKKRAKRSWHAYDKSHAREFDRTHAPSRHHRRKAAHRAGRKFAAPARDPRRFSIYEKGREELRGGYTVTWRPHGAFVQWYLRSPAGKVVAYGPARDGDEAIGMAKHALHSHEASPHTRIPHRRSEFTTRSQHYADKSRTRHDRKLLRRSGSGVN